MLENAVANPPTLSSNGVAASRRSMQASAARLCRQRGENFTALRRATLDVLLVANQPLGAYEILRRMEVALRRKFQPPSIYRALEFLESQGMISRLESRAVYIPNIHPERPNTSVYFLCDRCSDAQELPGGSLRQMVSECAASVGFRVRRHVIECEGTCAKCTRREVGI